MAKITVESLAKQLKVSSGDVLKCLESIGVFVPNAKAPLEMEEIRKVCVKLTGKEPRFKRPAAKSAAGKPASKKEENKPVPKKQEEPSVPEKKQEEPTAPEKKEEAAAKTAPEKKETVNEKPISPKKEVTVDEKPIPPKKEEEPPKESVVKEESPRSVKPEKKPDKKQEAVKEKEPQKKTERPETSAKKENASKGDRPRTNRNDRNENQNRSERNQNQNQRGGRNQRPNENRGKDRNFGDSRGNVRPQSGNRGGRNQEELSIPEAPKEVTAAIDKPKKTERMRRDKDKEKERAKNVSQDGFGRRHNKNFMVMGEEDEEVVKNRVKKNKPAPKPQEEEEEIKVVQLPAMMTVREFADLVKKPVTQIIKSLMLKGKMMGQNDDLDYEQAEAMALEMDILAEPMQEEDIFKAYMERQDAPESLKSRPPVVVVMGHVDHGKTSLLDAIRKTKVTAGEAGGITQHIGASVVGINGRKITFLDTPGHEAFTAMRLRGAQVTDIAILVVAADDGIMPQTIEAINHAKAAGVQIIVAINKMDKPEANPDHVKQQLTEYELIPEEWGGSTICVPVSAKTGEGIDTLLEMILLVADMEEYKANPDRPATGHVIEAQLDKGRGVVATALVQNGTLRIGDSIVVGKAFGRVKAMSDDKGKKVKSAGPSDPVEILGLSEVPVAGEQFFVTPSEREARQLAEKVSAKDREKLLEGTKKVSLESLFDQIQAGSMKELNIIVKADVQGSVEAVRQSLEKLSNDEVVLRIVHGGVGAINESDVTLASASNSIIIGFNGRPDAGAKAVAEREKVDMRLYRVIYDAIEDIEDAMKGMLDPEFQEKIDGHAQVRQTFKVSGIGTIAGCYVTDGKITRGSKARLVRDGIVVYEGEIDSLRRFKDDVKEVATNYECGIMLKSFSDVKEGDTIEAFSMEEIARS